MPTLAEAPISTLRATAPTARAFAHVEVHRDAAPVLAAWAELETSAPCSIYQTRAFLLPWIEHLAGEAGLMPVYVLARAERGRPAALLCLGLRRHGPLRIAHWLGGRDVNFNMPLVARGDVWSRREILRLLRDANVALGREAPHLYALLNQPFAWHDAPNPMAQLPHQTSPSAAYATALQADHEAFIASRFSKDARRKLRKKEARLATLGPVSYVRALDRDTRERVIGAFLEMRNARFRAQHIPSPFESPAMRAFIATASEAEPPGIELHALTVGARIVAAWGGAAHQGQWSGMFTAFDMDEAIAPGSPGEILLSRLLAETCKAGLTRFDLGVGAGRYKTSVCDEEVALFDTFVAVTMVGRLLALGLGAQFALKRVVKANPRLLAKVRRVASVFSRLRGNKVSQSEA